MIKFIKKVFYTLTPILVIIIVVNYFGDAANLFHVGYEQKIASIIKEGKFVTNISNYDERILQKEIIKNLVNSPDIAVLGSSRTMLINQHIFNSKYLINNSVSGATIEDIIAVYQIYKEENILPKKIIIATDPWIFNQNMGQNRWKSLDSEFLKFTNGNKKEENSLLINRNFFELISLSYFQNSLKNIPNFVLDKKNPVSTEKKLNVSITKLTDGSIIYGEKYRNATKKEIENRVTNYLQGKMYGIGDFNKLSPKLISLFNLLIKDMKNNKIQIVLFLAPYHPRVYDKVKIKYPLVLKTEKYLLNFAKKNNIEIYGSFNPKKLNLTEDTFYDGMHSKEEGIEIIFRNKINNGKMF